MIYKITTNYPTAKIHCCSLLEVANSYSAVPDKIYPRVNTNNNTVPQFNEIIKIICDSFGVHFIDLHNLTNMNFFNIETYTIEGLHPNRMGAKNICNIISKELI